MIPVYYALYVHVLPTCRGKMSVREPGRPGPPIISEKPISWSEQILEKKRPYAVFCPNIMGQISGSGPGPYRMPEHNETCIGRPDDNPNI